MSPETIFIKPSRPDMLVRDPQTGKALLVSGEWKQPSSHWQRRLWDGSVVEAVPVTKP